MREMVILLRFIIFGLMIFIRVPFIDAQSRYPVTSSTLQTLYHNETQDHLTYLAYAQKAISENYPRIAYFFVTLAASESIHARNYRQILSDLGIKVKETPKPEIKVSTTKENLKSAIHSELHVIDQRYPQFIEKIRPEKHETAIQSITYAWEGEKQHRDLIEKIKSGTGIFFGFLAQKIEKTLIQFHICQGCGSPVVELSKDICSICQCLPPRYKEVEMVK